MLKFRNSFNQVHSSVWVTISFNRFLESNGLWREDPRSENVHILFQGLDLCYYYSVWEPVGSADDLQMCPQTCILYWQLLLQTSSGPLSCSCSSHTLSKEISQSHWGEREWIS